MTGKVIMCCFTVISLPLKIMLQQDFILHEVAPRWKYKTVIAGKRPSDEMMHEASRLKHVKIIPNPSLVQMNELISNAQVCLLNASQPSGMKLKLINALCQGRHVVTSVSVVAGTHLESLCNLASGADEWVSLTDRLMKEDFTPEMREKRKLLLSEIADNNLNARKIVEFIENNQLRP